MASLRRSTSEPDDRAAALISDSMSLSTRSKTPDESGLKCVACHRVYPIRDSIPVMLVDEAKIEE